MSRIRSWWAWLANPDNRAILALLGGAAATVIGGAWALYIHFSKPPETKQANTGVQFYGPVTSGRDVNIHKD